MIVINFKEYPESTGLNALKLARICDEVSAKTGVRIIVCPSAFDLREVKESVKIEVYAQHVDNVDSGKQTGYLPAEIAKSEGADGTLLNHTEHHLDYEILEQTSEKVIKSGLNLIICAKDASEAEKVKNFNPEYIALEIPELIAGDKSIVEANPEEIRKTASKLGNVKMLVGSGIKTSKDIKTALDLGAKGVLIASAIDLSNNPKVDLLSLVNAFI